jgi:urease accessory protein
VLGIVGVPISGIETGIASSAIVLGLLILLAIRLPLWLACIIVGVFAIFHGYAHGTELPQAANPLAFIIGFVLATGMLHLIGIGFGLLLRWPAGKVAVRTLGGIISMAGIGFLFGIA